MALKVAVAALVAWRPKTLALLANPTVAMGYSDGDDSPAMLLPTTDPSKYHDILQWGPSIL